VTFIDHTDNDAHHNPALENLLEASFEGLFDTVIVSAKELLARSDDTHFQDIKNILSLNNITLSIPL
jgi:hypothetical protein